MVVNVLKRFKTYDPVKCLIVERLDVEHRTDTELESRVNVGVPGVTDRGFVDVDSENRRGILSQEVRAVALAGGEIDDLLTS